MYCTLTEAATYFLVRLNTEVWDTATSIEKTKALTMATRAIDMLNFQGERTDSTLPSQFPRGGDTIVPQEIKDATCEIALALLNDKDPEDLADNQRILSERYATVGVTYGGRDSEAVENGIPSITAWRLLKPFLRDPRALHIVRGVTEDELSTQIFSLQLL